MLKFFNKENFNINDTAVTMHYVFNSNTKRDKTQYVYVDSYLKIKVLKKKKQLIVNLIHLELYPF